MSRTILFEDKLKEKVLSGIEFTAKAVGKTLGPHGKFGMIEIPYGMPRLTKDGVSLAKQIVLKDPFENMGAQLIKEVSSQEDTTCGDGTTTTSIVASAFCKEGYKAYCTGVSATSLKKGIEDAVNKTIEVIKKNSKTVSSIDDIKNVAMVSSNGDEKIASLITEAFERVGNDGIITVDESKTGETYLSTKEGMNLDKGWISPYFINNDRGEVDLKDALVLITDETISNGAQIIKILNFIANSGKPFFIIADDIVGEALPLLTLNVMQGKLRGCAIKAPSYGQFRKDILEDIAIMTGATYISKDKGLLLNGVMPQDVLGSIDKVVVSKDSTILVGGHGKKIDVEDRIDLIKHNLKNETEEVPIEKLKDRLAKLSGGICILNVFAKTEPELNELKDRVTDTLSSVRSSIKEGVVCGGGTIYALASKTIKPSKDLTEDELIGFNIVKKALLYPLKTLAINADMSADNVVKETLDKVNGKNGFNIKTREWDEELYTKVVDPVSVEINALKNSASICHLFLNADVGICEDREKEEIKK